MKKIISLILAVIMLFSAVPMQSFALGAELEKVEYTDSYPISNKYVQRLAESPLTYPDWIEYDLMYESMYYFDLYFSNGVILNHGGYYEFDLWRCGIESFDAELFVDAQECQKAIDEGRSTVKATIRATLFKLGGGMEVHDFEIEKEIVDEIVRSVKPVDPAPENHNVFNPVESFVGKDFEIEYFDRKETHTLVYDEDTFDHRLNGEHIEIWYDERENVNEETGEVICSKGFDIDYLDCEAFIYEEAIPCPFESVDIIDYEINRKAQLEYVKYAINYKDGRTVEKTNTFKEPISITEEKVIDSIDGYDIKAYINVYDTYFWFSIKVGYSSWYMNGGLTGNATDVCKCICHKNGIAYLFSLLLIRIWQIFGIKQACECDYVHW